MNGINLDHQKSMRLFNISGEAKKMKAFARGLLKRSKEQVSPEQRDELKSQAKSLIDGANVVLKQARIMHFKGATPEVIEKLDEILDIVKRERKGLDTIKIQLKI